MRVFRASLDVFATAAGGRATPVRDGYHPQWGAAFVDGGAWHSGRVELADGAEIAPGGRGIVHIVPLDPAGWAAVREGAVLDMREGSRRVGEAHVLAVIER